MVDLEVTLLIPEADDTNHGVAVDYKGVEFWIITATPHANEPGPIIHLAWDNTNYDGGLVPLLILGDALVKCSTCIHKMKIVR